MGKTVDEFDKAVENLYGKSPEEVAKVLGKPNEYSKGGVLNNGDSFDCFGYEGVKDPITGKLSRGTSICFLNDKLVAKRPSHSF